MTSQPFCRLPGGRGLACLLAFALIVSISSAVRAGEVTMLSGYKIPFEGKPHPAQGLTMELIRHAPSGPIKSYPFTVFTEGRRSITLAQRQVLEVQLGGATVAKHELKLPPGGRSRAFGAVGGKIRTTPFSEFGRRIITLMTPNGELEVVQAISELRPDYVTLSALQYDWSYGVKTDQIPTDILRSTLSQTIDEQSIEDRLSIVRFFVGAQMFIQAQQELDRIEQEFPDLKNRVEQLRLQIRQLLALQFRNEFETRITAGQYELVYQMAQKFPRKDINAAILADVDRLLKEHEKSFEQMDQVRAGLSRLQADIGNPQQLERFQDMRSVVDRNLNRHDLERLIPFLQNLDDNLLKPEEKLALAYSGWVVGPAQATTDPAMAESYWAARDLVRAYLRSENPLTRRELYAQLRRLEGIGPDALTAIVRRLGPAFETPRYQQGQPIPVKTNDLESPISYEVLLPYEYQPTRSYPLVLALPSAGIQPQQEVAWWGGVSLAGEAHRYGMIVVSPELSEGATDDTSVRNSEVLEVLRDVRRKFAVDSDRVFIAGHGSGADTAINAAMSHPSEFAGLVSIGGRFDDYAHHYWKNCELVPSYYVVGELDADLYAANAPDWTRMLKYGQDILLCQFRQRGREDYREELPEILKWMSIHQRSDLPQELERVTMRTTDNQFDWLQFSGLPPALTDPRTTASGRILPATPMPVEATITPGNNIFLKLGTDKATVWLSPEMVDFDDRIKIRWKGRTRFNDFPEPDAETMLERLYNTGDRQRLFWTRIDL